MLEAILSEFFLIPDACDSESDPSSEHDDDFELEGSSLDDDVAASLAFAQRLVVQPPPIPVAPTIPAQRVVSTPAGR